MKRRTTTILTLGAPPFTVEIKIENEDIYESEIRIIDHDKQKKTLVIRSAPISNNEPDWDKFSIEKLRYLNKVIEEALNAYDSLKLSRRGMPYVSPFSQSKGH